MKKNIATIIIFLLAFEFAACSSDSNVIPLNSDETLLCTDTDGDGFAVTDEENGTSECSALADCDDGNDQIFPGAFDNIDNGVDEDCDGADSHADLASNSNPATPPKPSSEDAPVNAGTSGAPMNSPQPPLADAPQPQPDCSDCAPMSYCTDADGDGVTVPGEEDASSECSELVDCDDNDNTIFPGATERAGNGIDEDCNGSDATKKTGSIPVPTTTSIPTQPESYEIDSAMVAFRGMKWDYSGANAATYNSIGGGTTFKIDSLGMSALDSNGDGVPEGVDFMTYADFNQAGNDNIKYNWETLYTGVAYDSATLSSYSAYEEIICASDADGYCEKTLSIDVASVFGPQWARNQDGVTYWIAVDGFYMLLDGGLNRGLGGDDLLVKAWVDNADSETHSEDLDGADGQSDGNDHYMGEDGMITIHLGADFNGPGVVEDYSVNVVYSVIAVKNAVWGVSQFDWNDGVITGSRSTIKLTGLTDLQSKDQAFVILQGIGFDGSVTGTFEIDNLYSHVTLSSIASETATLNLFGAMNGYAGTETSAAAKSIKSNATMGFLLYCKDADACQTKEGFNSESEDETADDDNNDSFDSAAEEVVF